MNVTLATAHVASDHRIVPNMFQAIHYLLYPALLLLGTYGSHFRSSLSFRYPGHKKSLPSEEPEQAERPTGEEGKQAQEQQERASRITHEERTPREKRSE